MGRQSSLTRLMVGPPAVTGLVPTLRMAENIDVFDFRLTDDEMARIAVMDTDASLFPDHRDPTVVSQLGTYRLG
jgi:hypothetical protein